MQFFPGEVLRGDDGAPREQVLQQSSEFSGEVGSVTELGVPIRRQLQ